MKNKLTLLGVWNILPVGAWTWFNDTAADTMKKLTGRTLGTFFYLQDDLNYECFEEKDTDLLKKDLDKLSFENQKKYIKNITSDYYSQAKSLEKTIEKVERIKFSDLSNTELASIVRELAEIWSKTTMHGWYAVLLDIWYPHPKDKEVLKSTIAESRDHCGHLHERSDIVERDMYLEIAKRTNLSEREVYFMIQSEIVDMLNGKNLPTDVLSSRMELCIGTNYKGVFTLYGGNEAHEVEKDFYVPKIGPKKEILKGTPACLGKVRGKARVVLLDKDFSSFKEGEILVCLQTMVHYVPIMKKASAIISEFGGLTSHTAIVSRELNTPAVVGISGLISSIQTGDMIEVDAHKGTVKKV